MTVTIEKARGVWGSAPSTNYEQLATRYRDIFQRIREGAVHRENERKLLFEEINLLKEAGFGAIRIPREEGGLGATIPELFNLLIELGEADSNLPQALRAHFAFVEMVLNSPEGELRSTWIKRILEGDIVGNAWSEVAGAKAGTFLTKVTKGEGDQLYLNGTKYYSTGTIYADWILVLATKEEENKVFAVISRYAKGVNVIDDWDGFGQKLTGSGTTTFTDVQLQESEILTEEFNATYQAAFFQMMHLATLAGIARAAANDVSKAVAERKRTYTHSAGARSSEDPQVLQVVGKIHSLAYSSGAIVLKAAESLQNAYELHLAGNGENKELVNDEVEIEVSQAQVVVSSLTLDATALLFDALGASATLPTKSFDRYWRNARTIASHNPLIYKERVVGDYAVNKTRPPYVWHVGKSNISS
ncbi:acyl-CoA dehydrogenase family protein [Bacillus sinesaloumensis]|uniref:acyl-CoA dehydrogenase family protein n=1 Tax=Litchfieldia sinesaloumensis TaxID=1926280 RepID=UPI000988601E|nr:acyl-CoA dehydrogenase family protein [Bacillus sinesaloumensis]